MFKDRLTPQAQDQASSSEGDLQGPVSSRLGGCKRLCARRCSHLALYLRDEASARYTQLTETYFGVEAPTQSFVL